MGGESESGEQEASQPWQASTGLRDSDSQPVKAVQLLLALIWDPVSLPSGRRLFFTQPPG